MRASGLVLVLALGLAAAGHPDPGGPVPALQVSEPQAGGPLGMDTYVQGLEISFADEATAQAAKLTVAPLLNDAQWALTQRWDDNLIDSLRVRDLLNRRKMHGTFYLNASDAWYSNETHYPFAGDPRRELAPALMKGGHSIGGHGLTHSFIPCLNRSEMFRELLGVRIDREVNSQSPVVSFVFPFTRFRNDLEGAVVQADLAQLLKRGGYYHVANQYFNTSFPGESGILDSWLLPCDGTQPIDPAVKGLLASERQHGRSPVLCMCMHAWPAKWGGNGFPQLDRALLRWSARKSWWYAQANELAAYRYQKAHAQLSGAVQGSQLKASLLRQEPMDLGDAGPLTLKLTHAGAVTPQARAAGRELKVWRAKEKGAWLVELPHEPGHGLPQAYEWHRNPRNEPRGLDSEGKGVLPGLASRLWLEDGALHFRLHDKARLLEDLRLQWRLPLGFEAAPAERRPELKRGQSLELSLPLTARQGALLRQGRFYAAVQLDARAGGRALRLYSDVQGSEAERDPSFPKGGFLVLGPLPGDRKDLDLAAFTRKVLQRSRPRPCEALFGEEKACWQAHNPSRLEPLHPELVPAGAMMAPHTFYTWDPGLYYPHGHHLQYLMMSDVYSPQTQGAKIQMPRGSVRRLMVNGVRIKGRTLTLRPGANRMLIHYVPGTADGEGQASFSEKNYGPFFRLVDKHGKRLENIRYEMPPGLTLTASLRS